MRKILSAITTRWKGFAGSLGITVGDNPTGLDLKGTTNIESKRLLPMTRDLRDRDTGYPSGIFKQTTGSTTTTNTTVLPPLSLIMMVSRMLTTLGLVTMGLLLVALTMLIPYSRREIIVRPVVIAISVVCISRIAHTLKVLSGWSRAVSKAQKKAGRGKPTVTGGRVL